MAFWSTLGNGILDGFAEIGRSYIRDASIWWVLAPVIILWIVLEVYFGEYKKEKLGWNTSLANGITLLWVNIEAMRFIFSIPGIDMKWIRFVVLLFILAYAGFIIYISFTHKFSAKVTYILASASPIYYLSMISILWSHGQLQMTWWVLLDLILLFGLLLFIFWIIRKFIPEAANDNNDSSGGDDFGSSSSPSDSMGGLGSGGLGGLGDVSGGGLGGDFKL
ncbi:hypothetical protein HN419_05740 [Candidatus Woesearchaeota archaeon]|jgi:hypothetical protein|nr:hypothetical protein [Candidatus Woesearchaeota archaeon]MBT3537628.1 hypothetical protein [Candidatus Woesearchaeota archaeon]MBT4698438.1 hypothetical protein [Candidatus Woesearchaeota archaeon]MBT4716653.1 hypothetical protein [Candidatus Woesearchaeota archaeon]MBT7105297.1 hypothetical protein [Candidatus Woesearchaeota archaeon]